jgi:hypothetical protein
VALPLSVGPDADARLLLFAVMASPRGLRMLPKPAIDRIKEDVVSLRRI